MKKFLSFACIAAVTLLSSCKPESKTHEPVLTIEGKTEIILPYIESEFDIVCKISNSIDGGELTAESNAEWIANNGLENGTFKFTAAANTVTDLRNAVIKVQYTWADGVSEKEIKVTQSGTDEVPADYNQHAQFLWGEYYGDPDEDGKFRYLMCISEKELNSSLQPTEEGIYYFIELFGEESSDSFTRNPNEGEYKVDAIGNDENNIITKDNSFIIFVNAEGTITENVKLKTGSLILSSVYDEEIEYDRPIYTMNLTDANGKIHKVVYDGQIPLFIDRSPKYSYIREDFNLNAKFCDIKGTPFQGLVNATMVLSDKGQDVAVDAGCIVLKFIMPYDPQGNIPAGTYTITPLGDFSKFSIEPGREIEATTPYMGSMAKKFDADGWTQLGLLTDGKMIVSGTKENYTITCDFTTREGVKVTGAYTGAAEIDGFTEAFSTLTEDYVLDLSGAEGTAIYRAGGEWNIELGYGYGEDGDCFNISFITGDQSADKGIESGTYKVATEGTPKKGEYAIGYMNMGMPAGTYFYNGMDWASMPPYKILAPAIDGDFIIENLGNNEYSISFEFTDDLGFKWSGSWNGVLQIRDFS